MIRSRTTLVVAGFTSAALLATGGVALAHGGGNRGGASPGHGQVVHSEAVVRNGTGFTTRLQQFGTVTDVTPTTLTVLSADGFSQTWALNSSTKYRSGRSSATLATIADGDTVAVDGTRVSGTPTAQRVDERAPKPSPSASSSPTT